jgi:hypothetical protein
MPTNYTSRDFGSVKSDLISRAKASLPEWSQGGSADFAMTLVDLWSYIADVQNYYIDRAHTEAFLDTATQRGPVHALARLMGYVPNPRTASTGTVTVSNSSGSSQTIAKGTQFVVNDTANVPKVYFTSSAALTIANGASGNVPLVEGRSITSTLTTNYDGAPSGTFQLSETGVIPSSLSVTVGSTTYTHNPRMTEVSADTPAFTSVTGSNDNTVIAFGNGINGLVPSAGSTITVTYRVGQGAVGNVAANSLYTPLGGFDATPTAGLATTASTATTGGSDPESLSSIKQNAPKVRRTQDRAVTLNDYKDLMRGFAGVMKTHAITSLHASTGAATVKFIAIPNYANFETLASGTTSLSLTANFGTAGTEINSNLATYLTDRSMVGVTAEQISATISLNNVYIDLNELVVKSGYYQSEVKDAVTTALRANFTWGAVEFDQVVKHDLLTHTVLSVAGVQNARISHIGNTAGGSNAANYTTTATTTSAVHLPVLRGIAYTGVTGGN